MRLVCGEQTDLKKDEYLKINKHLIIRIYNNLGLIQLFESSRSFEVGLCGEVMHICYLTCCR